MGTCRRHIRPGFVVLLLTCMVYLVWDGARRAIIPKKAVPCRSPEAGVGSRGRGERGKR